MLTTYIKDYIFQNKSVFVILLLIIINNNISSNDLFISSIEKSYKSSKLKKASDQKLKSEKAKAFIALSDYLPSVKGTGEFWQHNNEMLAEKYQEQEFLIAGKLTQSIIDIQRISNIVEARKNLNIEKENIRIENQNILRDLIILWINYSHSKKLYLLSQYADSLALMHLSATEKRFESGDLTKTDVFQAQSRYFSARLKLERDSIELMQSKILFTTDFNIPKTKEVVIPTFKVINWKQASLDSLIELMPEIAILKEKLKISSINLLSNSTKKLPKLTLLGEISRNWDKSVSYKPYPYDDIAIGLELSIPFWESGKSIAETISSNALKKRQKLILDKVVIFRSSYITNLIHHINKYRNQLYIFQKSQQAAENSLEGITIEFNIGNRNSINVMDAQSELTDIKIEFEKSKNILFMSYIDLFYSLGILNIPTIKEFLQTEDTQ